jgi:hypothetical protein
MTGLRRGAKSSLLDLVIEAGAQIEGVAVIVDESSPEVRSVLPGFHALMNAGTLEAPC